MFKLIFFIMIAVIIQFCVIQIVKRARAFSTIFHLSPAAHQKKAKTPSFGGVAIILSTLIGISMFHIQDKSILWLSAVGIIYMGIGFADDLMSLLRKQNLGLWPRQKLIAQLVAAIVLVSLFHFAVHPIKLWQWFFYIFVMIGASNATNLTDGLDGLLAGLSIITCAGLYLWMLNLNLGTVAMFCFILLICTGAFLLFNFKPALIFMGDTGSLALGALFAGISIIAGNPFMLLFLGAVYIIETLSVIVQVAWYKRTKRRVFLMTPLHHHFELLGLSELKTVALFWSVGAMFFILFLIRIGIMNG